ncbi:TatD family hydrolase [Candidatus Parcubacteria bacterium]|jgi:TatD DNase family protein|nr:TatD family hydrolase [Candidatus Parcubacteria bacterium]
MLIDSHSHLNFEAYKDDLSEVIGRCHQAKMKVINVGAALDTSIKAVEIAQQEKDMYATIGLHPIHVFDEEFDAKVYQKIIDENPEQIVAMGETGFDYFHLWQCLEKGAASIEEAKAKQTEVFGQHVDLAKKNNLPLMVHGRNGKEDITAYQDIYNLLKELGYNKGMVHCYGGSLKEAKKFVELGFHIGFTGIATFDKTGVLEEIIKWIPQDKMIIETDAPYLTPVPHRGKRNEPVFVKNVADKIAQIKSLSVEEVIEITGNNSINLFNLK